MDDKIFIVFQNVGAGTIWFVETEEKGNWTYQELGGSHANVLDEFSSEEVAQLYIDEIIKNSTKYVIFTSRNDDGTDGYWIEEMNANSGTYQEVGGSRSDWLKEYKTLEVAQKHLAEDY
jgi:hypothetical protein